MRPRRLAAGRQRITVKLPFASAARGLAVSWRTDGDLIGAAANRTCRNPRRKTAWPAGTRHACAYRNRRSAGICGLRWTEAGLSEDRLNHRQECQPQEQNEPTLGHHIASLTQNRSSNASIRSGQRPFGKSPCHKNRADRSNQGSGYRGRQLRRHICSWLSQLALQGPEKVVGQARLQDALCWVQFEMQTSAASATVVRELLIVI
jgi:hypothetical protein